MSTTTSAATTTQRRAARLAAAFEAEHATTLRVLKAYPESKLDLRPHAKSKTARELAWTLATEPDFALKAITTGIDWTASHDTESTPASLDPIVERLEAAHGRLMETLRGLSDADLDIRLQFPVAPRTMGELTRNEFLWMMLSDQIHHRGQFSVYLRLADAAVPSIYGPTADEPWN